MSSSSSSAPSTSSSSSISCVDCCKFEPIINEEGEFEGWNKICCDCGEDEFCDSPDINGDNPTPCQQYVPPGSSSNGQARSMGRMQELLESGTNLFVRVPNVRDPSRWSTSRLRMIGDSMIFEDSGWTLVIMRVKEGPTAPIITPHLAPTDSILFNDRALSAYVIVPEGDVPTQYWVTVAERFGVFGRCYAMLQTANWTISFYRDPT